MKMSGGFSMVKERETGGIWVEDIGYVRGYLLSIKSWQEMRFGVIVAGKMGLFLVGVRTFSSGMMWFIVV